MDARANDSGSNPAFSRWMTLPEAARVLSMNGTARAAAKRLATYIRKRERIANVAIIIDVGTEKLPRFVVTLALLREHLPELFDTRVALTELVREHVADMERRLHQLERQDEVLAGELERIAVRCDDAA